MVAPSNSSESYVSKELLLIWGLLTTLVVITYFIQRYQWHFVPPSGIAMVLGMVAGMIFRLSGYALSLRFSQTAFFYALLPPIVFAAGFSLKRRRFFKYFSEICVFAVLGTVISTVVFGLFTWLLAKLHIVSAAAIGTRPLTECLMYGAAISSIDPVATLSVFSDLPVPPLLYNLVFGESVLNDAVSIVLFRTVQEFREDVLGLKSIPMMCWRFGVIFSGSCIIGIGVALLAAFLMKRFPMSGGRADGGGYAGDGNGVSNNGGVAQQDDASPSFDGCMYEIAFVVMSSYMAYLVSEAMELSGIVSLFFTGICHAHYTYYNTSHDSQIALTKCFNFFAFLCETFVFAYLGIQVATMRHKFDAGLLLSGIPLCVLSRAVNIFPLAALINLGRKYPLPLNLQAMQLATGLRGAVAYGLVIQIKNDAIETATLFIVVVTTLVLGGLTGPLLRFLKLEGKDDAELLLVNDSPINDYVSALLASATGRPRSRADDTPPRTPMPAATVAHVRATEIERPSWLHQQWKLFDTWYMKPLFGGRPAGPRMHGDHGGITDSDDEGTYLMQPQQQGVAQHTVFMGAPTAHVSDVELLGGASEVYVAGKDTPPAAPQEDRPRAYTNHTRSSSEELRLRGANSGGLL